MERFFSAERISAPLARLTSKPASMFKDTGGKTIKERGELEEPRCSPLLECPLSSPAVWSDEFPSAPRTKVWGCYKTQNNFLAAHGQVAGCYSTCVLDLMRSSPSSCFVKQRQIAAVIAGTETPNLLAEHSQALSTHIPTFSHTDGSWSQLSLFSDKEFAFPECFPKFTTLHQANLYNKQHLKTLVPIWALGCVSQQPGWVFRKTAKKSQTLLDSVLRRKPSGVWGREDGAEKEKNVLWLVSVVCVQECRGHGSLHVPLPTTRKTSELLQSPKIWERQSTRWGWIQAIRTILFSSGGGQHLWRRFHIIQVPDEAALESHLHLDRSSSTARPGALQRSAVSGLWVLHGKKRLKVLPQLSEAEKPDQNKKGKKSLQWKEIYI